MIADSYSKEFKKIESVVDKIKLLNLLENYREFIFKSRLPIEIDLPCRLKSGLKPLTHQNQVVMAGL